MDQRKSASAVVAVAAAAAVVVAAAAAEPNRIPVTSCCAHIQYKQQCTQQWQQPQSDCANLMHKREREGEIEKEREREREKERENEKRVVLLAK